MATYKEIKGSNVENFSSDPANPINGQVWYNTTSSTLKVAEVTLTSSWATGGSLSGGARYNPVGAGTFGGAPGTPAKQATEEYNGTAWTNGGNLGTPRETLAGCGTQTAGLAFGGSPSAAELYDGTSWTNGGTMNTPRSYPGGAGTQAAGLAMGGATPSYTTATEEFTGPGTTITTVTTS